MGSTRGANRADVETELERFGFLPRTFHYAENPILDRCPCRIFKRKSNCVPLAIVGGPVVFQPKVEFKDNFLRLQVDLEGRVRVVLGYSLAF